MAQFVKAARVSDVGNGSMKTVTVSGKNLALANVDGEIFAVDDVCSHEHCSLGSEGFLDGSTIICGCHGGQFDATSGKVLAQPATVDLSSYKTRIEGDDILVEV